MRRFRPYLPTVALGLLVVLSCTDGTWPTLPADGSRESISFSVTPTVPAGVSVADALPINLIRVRVTAGSTEEVVATQDFSVSPDQEEWSLDVEFSLKDSPETEYVLILELINSSGGVESIQWSGRAGPFSVLPGIPMVIRGVELVRGPADNLFVTALSVTGPESLPEGSSFQLTAETQSASADANPTVYWTSLDPQIATVEDDGSGVALRAGVARIEAVAGAAAAVHEIEVLPVPTSVTIEPGSVELTEIGEEVTFTARVLDGSGDPMPEDEVEFGLSGDGVIESLGGGTFRAVGEGSVEVIASAVSDPSVSASAQVTVDVEIDEITIEPESATLNQLGAQQTFTVRAFSNGVEIASSDASFTSSQPGVATVDGSGVATAVADGDTEITATLYGLSATATLTVDLIVDRVVVSPQSVFLISGESYQLTATAYGIGGQVIPASFTWSSSNLSIVTVSSDGVVEAISYGSAVVAATAKGAIGSSQIEVLD